MTIHIQSLEFQCILGILDFERTNQQNICIDTTIEYNYLQEYINYADVSSFIKQHIKKQKFLLIEEALASLALHLKKEFHLIQTLHLKITKPSILPDCRVSVANSYSFDS